MTDKFIEKEKVLEFLESTTSDSLKDVYITSVFYVVILLIFMLILFLVAIPFFLIEHGIKKLFSKKKEVNNENSK